jgi:hypothetical protein
MLYVIFASRFVATGLSVFVLGLAGIIGCAGMVAGGWVHRGQISHLSPTDA